LASLRGVNSPTQQQIKSAYRHKAKTAHPDAGGSEDAFHKLTEAFRVLSDPIQRERYDATGEIAPESADNARAGILSIINVVLNDLLFCDQDFLDVDLVGVIRDTLAQQIQSYETRIAKLTKAQERAKRMQGRFTAADGAELQPVRPHAR
jgi:DnaJ-class molecular chaperone